ncbi:MAG: hypothetical protein ACREV5_22205 [Steroidobacter sp.]
MNTRALFIPLILVASTGLSAIDASASTHADAHARAAALLSGLQATPSVASASSVRAESAGTDVHQQAAALLSPHTHQRVSVNSRTDVTREDRAADASTQAAALLLGSRAR